MTRLNIVLLAAVLVSAFYLVNNQYHSRRLVTELDRAVAEGRRLETEGERLEVDKRAQATSARVEQLARSKLDMRLAGPGITEYVSYRAAAASEAVR